MEKEGIVLKKKQGRILILKENKENGARLPCALKADERFLHKKGPKRVQIAPQTRIIVSPQENRREPRKWPNQKQGRALPAQEILFTCK